MDTSSFPVRRRNDDLSIRNKFFVNVFIFNFEALYKLNSQKFSGFFRTCRFLVKNLDFQDPHNLLDKK